MLERAHISVNNLLNYGEAYTIIKTRCSIIDSLLQKTSDYDGTIDTFEKGLHQLVQQLNVYNLKWFDNLSEPSELIVFYNNREPFIVQGASKNLEPLQHCLNKGLFTVQDTMLRNDTAIKIYIWCYIVNVLQSHNIINVRFAV